VWTAGAGYARIPLFLKVLLIEVTRDNYSCGNCIEHREDTDFYHELLKFFSFLYTLLFNNVSDAEKTDEAGQQEGSTEQKIHKERSEYESSKIRNILIADKADAGNGITIDTGHGEDGDALYRRYEPRNQMEVLGVASDRFLTPLESRGEEPC